MLKNIDGLHHIDYARYLWAKPNSFDKQLDFQNTGFVYGPIRLSARNQLAAKLLVRPASELDFVKDKTAIFFIRDPRDILVSSYYSFGFNHPLNPIPEKRKEQLKRRKAIQALTLDEYVLAYADQQIEYFDHLKAVAASCKKKAILRYEDMIDDFDLFIDEFQKVVPLNQYLIREIYKRSRPRKNISNAAHRRSGATRRFLKDLQSETIVQLNAKLAQTLSDFEYEDIDHRD
ncbi:MAG: sulfotransferase domain-containing protein [Bacteroidota bacterium]